MPAPPPRNPLPTPIWAELSTEARRTLVGAWAAAGQDVIRAAEVVYERQDPADPPRAAGRGVPTPVDDAAGARASRVHGSPVRSAAAGDRSRVDAHLRAGRG